MKHRFTPADEGKQVITIDGTVLGTVEHTECGVGYLQPRRKLVAGYGSWITGCLDGETVFPIDEAVVTAVDADRVVVDTGEEKFGSRIVPDL